MRGLFLWVVAPFRSCVYFAVCATTSPAVICGGFGSNGAMLLQQGSGAKPLLLTERDGFSQYTTVFFARRDSGIRSLADLRGRSVAFQAPYSTSAYYVPATALLDSHLPLQILLSPMDRPDPRGVGDRGQRRSQEAQPCGETTTEDNQSESPA